MGYNNTDTTLIPVNRQDTAFAKRTFGDTVKDVGDAVKGWSQLGPRKDAAKRFKK